MKNYKIRREFSELEEFTLNLPGTFDHIGSIIEDRRNIVKKVIVKQVLVFSHWARLLAYHLSSHFHYFISVSFDTCDQVRLVFLCLAVVSLKASVSSCSR